MSSPDKPDEATPALRENLPWHITGKLADDEHAQLDAALAQNKSLAAERGWLESVRDHIKHDTDLPDENAGFDKLMARIHGEQSGKVVSLHASRWQRWERAIFAVAATVVFAQAAVIGVMFKHQQQETSIAPLSGPTQAVGGATLQVTFRESATEAEIRAALIGANAEIVGGPGALGIYTVRVMSGPREAAVEKLRKSAAVESVTPLPSGS